MTLFIAFIFALTSCNNDAKFTNTKLTENRFYEDMEYLIE